MSKISSRIASEMDRSLREFHCRNLPHETFLKQPKDVHGIQELIEGGMEPLHAVYCHLQNVASLFAEGISELPEFDRYCEVVGNAQDLYMPNGPPMSPLTGSFFTTWAFFDFRFGKNRETIGTIMLDLAGKLQMDDFVAEALHHFQASRKGIYEHVGFAGKNVRLRELWTDKEFICHVPVKHKGTPGELWFIRLCPPVRDIVDYHVAWGTPYILQQTTKDDWIAFLNRTLVKTKDKEKGLYQFLKYGKSPNYWSEFVFLGYCGHTSEAIFLAGIPDIKSSLPHA